ncbi:MAG: ankyrin repeat domain-containing protein [Gammaproteobacteria bacterium]|nr:ankyrin repeat domain-containing protein [Gammaproteobacteria bacterium]
MARLAVAGALGVGMNAGCAVHPESADYYFTTPETVTAARAIRRGDARSLERMIAGGLDVNAQGREGMDLLKWSMGRFCLKCFETLLESGADIERPPAGEYTGKIEQLFLMPVMHLAAHLNDPAYLASLLRHGGNPNALNVYGARTIIHEAIMLSRIENVRLLVEAGADINAPRDISLETPLHEAVAVKEYEIAHYLLEQGADPMLENAWGNSVVDTIKLFKNAGIWDRRMHDWYLKFVDRLELDPDEVTLP